MGVDGGELGIGPNPQSPRKDLSNERINKL